MGRLTRLALFAVALMTITGCGDTPLQSLGLRSSEWINAPTVPTTVPVVTTMPTAIPTEQLGWSNDDIESRNLNDHDALLAEVFSRRAGDRFIQASRFEIAAALPGVAFPEIAPANGAKWVSSQLVFDNDGTLGEDPSAAFGIWSVEPYSRSRSVAQMIVLRVARDQESAEEVASGEEDPSCARFADRSTDQCEITTVDNRPTWLLRAAGDATLIWFDSPYRYELYGRSFVPLETLEDMSGRMVPLSSFDPGPS